METDKKRNISRIWLAAGVIVAWTVWLGRWSIGVRDVVALAAISVGVIGYCLDEIVVELRTGNNYETPYAYGFLRLRRKAMFAAGLVVAALIWSGTWIVGVRDVVALTALSFGVGVYLLDEVIAELKASNDYEERSDFLDGFLGAARRAVHEDARSEGNKEL